MYEKNKFGYQGKEMPYRIMFPEDYDKRKLYPLVIFLHGAGERGDDNEKQLIHGAKFFSSQNQRKQFPAIVIFPQCPENDYWSNVEIRYDKNNQREFIFKVGGESTSSMYLLEKLVGYIQKTLPINRNKIYMGGLSMGGMGTFEFAYRSPKVLAAAFAICGGANPGIASVIANIPWWIFHGEKDDVVSSKFSIQMNNALKKFKANVRLTIYEEAKHNSWDNAFQEKNLIPWLFSHENEKTINSKKN